jgi:hypothetical protein
MKRNNCKIFDKERGTYEKGKLEDGYPTSCLFLTAALMILGTLSRMGR